MGKLVEIECSEPQAEVLETTADRVLFLGGVGSGKTHVEGILSMDFILNNPEMSGFLGANTVKQLSGATLNRIFTVWDTVFGIKEDIHFVIHKHPPKAFTAIHTPLDKYEGVISFQNGARVFISSLENYEAIDGFEFGWALLDETKDTKEEAVKKVIIQRLRQKGMYINPKTREISKECKEGYQGYNPLFIFTSPAKTEWLAEWFNLNEYVEEITEHIFSKTDYFRKRRGRYFCVISSTWHNQHNLPPGYIEGMIDDLSHNQELVDMQIYASPFGKTGGEFITTFKRLQHVREFTPWADEAVHLTFDFNYVPYMTCTCWQMKWMEELPSYHKPGYLVRCFDEFCLPNPRNNCESISKEIKDAYELLLKNGMFYYGDYSGANGSPMLVEFKNYYQVIEKYLRQFISNSSKRVIVNQPLGKRRNFINKCFKGDYPLEIQIRPRCKQLIADCEFCKEGPDGGKLKELELVNDVKCQKRGHALDSMEYKFTSSFNNLFNNQ